MKKSNNFSEMYLISFALLCLVAALIYTVDFSDLLATLSQGWRFNKQIYTISRISMLDAFTPTIITCGFAFVITQLISKPNTWLRAFVGLLIFTLGIRYISWRFFGTLNLDNVPEGILSVAIFIAEFCMLIDTLFASCIQTVPSSNLSPLADEVSKKVIDKSYQPWVDVLIPSYNEPAEVLRRTIIACQALDYENKKIYLLDDTRRPEIKKLTKELGCYYIDRPDNKHAKAGNVNHALKKTDSVLITIFDADFVPSKNYLTRLVGFFQDENIAMVQTPQHFFSPDPVEANLGLEGGITNEQALFFRHIQPSRDAVNAVICCGTCYVVRRSCLEEIGGIPTSSIAEDFLTSVELIERGYRIRYLNEALSAGEAPPTIGAYIDQRLRWGQGTIQCLFIEKNPLTAKGLNFIQRAYFFSSVSYWFMPIFRMILFCGPLGYLIFGLNPLRATIEGIFSFFIPYYLANIILFSWTNKGRRSVFWSNIYETLLCYPMAATVVRSLINPFGKGFKVTPKGVEINRLEANWIVIRPLAILASLYVIGFVMRAPTLVWESNPEPVIVNLSWALYNIVTFWVAIMCALDVPRRQYIAFPNELDFTLKYGLERYKGKTLTLSEKDIIFEAASHEAQKLDTQMSMTIDIPSLGFRDIPVKWKDISDDPEKEVHKENRKVVEFKKLKEPEERKLIEYLYCRNGLWEKDLSINEGTYFVNLLQSVIRMNPLANSK
jgi:cellulose synthase (UDP-forming)